MTLSICLLVNDPPAHVAAALEPVRASADEVVIAADATVDDATLAAYAGLADRLLRVEFRMYERHLGWLHAQCRGDWILRLDGDEVPSTAFARRLPRLLEPGPVRQYVVRRAWLEGEELQVLEDEPWRSDYMNRLVRNDGTLHFPGNLHEHATLEGPAEFVEEPIYHLELVTQDERRRRDKAVRYEVQGPHRRARGGGRMNEAFYLPELRASLRRSPLPEEDRELVARALAADTPIPACDPGPLPVVPLAESDRHWDGRPVPESAYAATIEPLYPAPPMEPGEHQALMVRVTNDGTESWPWSLAHRPAIRIGHRWLHEDGSVAGGEGPRSAFQRPVGPGDTVVVPLHVVAPSEPGGYLLAADLVHEEVRWFGIERRIPVTVAPATHLPAFGPRLRPTPKAAEGDAMSIPRTLHRVWVGDEPMQAAHREYGEGFARLHPGWEVRLWGEADLAELEIGDAEFAAVRGPSELSNLMRYEILRRHGGVYADTDFEFVRPLDDLLAGVDAFAALEAPGRLGNAIIGAIAGHHLFGRAAALARRTLGTGANSADANGPYLLTLIVEQEPDGITIFDNGRFYPYRWDEPERGAEAFPDAHAVHRWALTSWRTPSR